MLPSWALEFGRSVTSPSTMVVPVERGIRRSRIGNTATRGVRRRNLPGGASRRRPSIDTRRDRLRPCHPVRPDRSHHSHGRVGTGGSDRQPTRGHLGWRTRRSHHDAGLFGAVPWVLRPRPKLVAVAGTAGAGQLAARLDLEPRWRVDLRWVGGPNRAVSTDLRLHRCEPR